MIIHVSLSKADRKDYLLNITHILNISHSLEDAFEGRLFLGNKKSTDLKRSATTNARAYSYNQQLPLRELHTIKISCENFAVK